MRTWIVAIVAVLLGCVGGIVSTWAEFAGVSQPGNRHPSAVVLNGADYDFGSMKYNTTRKHKFQFKNIGTKPLKLTKGESSCKCTISALAKELLQPGETAYVTLEWTPKDFSPDFRQSADIITNDPSRPMVQLTVHGQVTHAVRIVPRDLVFSTLSSDEEKLGQIRVFGYREEAVKIEKYEFSNPDSKDLFELKIVPLSEAETAKETGATSGLLLKVVVKSGLPLGAIQQTIRLTTNYKEMRVLEIPIQGTVISDISIYGRKFDNLKNLLILGSYKRSQGATVKLNMLVKGPYRDEVKLTVGKIDPDDVLRATIGEPIANRDGKSLTYPLIIKIPPGSRAVNRIGSRQSKLGKIIIETTHPTAKQVQVFVSFSTEGS